MTGEHIQSYQYNGIQPSCTSAYLWPHVTRSLRSALPSGGRVFELGCGNGATARMLAQHGYSVTGVDLSESGIAAAKSEPTTANFAIGSAYDNLAETYGRFPAVLSLEVVEHCYWPRTFAKTLFDLLEPGGLAIISTPYHGYLKNLLLAVFNRFDSHWSPLWDGGHIKFWSERTLRELLEGSGFHDVRFVRAGRVPPLARSMIAIARRPAG